MIKQFNVILDNPPEKKWPGVVEKTDFKQVLKFFQIMSRTDIDEQRKAFYVLRVFFKDGNAPNDPKLWDQIIEFIACGEDKENEAQPERTVFDYNVDHGRIFAAFWQAYGIDLRTVDMHWWAFCELFNNLPDETKLMQIVELRSRKAGKNDSPEYKKQLRKMQNSVRIDSGQDALTAALDRW